MEWWGDRDCGGGRGGAGVVEGGGLRWVGWSRVGGWR